MIINYNFTYFKEMKIKMKKAFTLAEVLLTLAIIGVVAALTIPAVVTKVTKDQYVVGLQKAHNTLKAVVKASEHDNGEVQYWNFGGWDDASLKTAFETYFLPYFDVLKDCGVNTGEGCFAQESYKALNGGEWLGGTPDNTGAYKIITSDGISYSYHYGNSGNGGYGYFFVDVNGPKGPNTWGRDFFSFNVTPGLKGIKPDGSYNTDTGENLGSDDMNCNTETGMGMTCARKVLAEGAMNY